MKGLLVLTFSVVLGLSSRLASSDSPRLLTAGDPLACSKRGLVALGKAGIV